MTLLKLSASTLALVALSATGGVITSAGLVLAATFGVLASLPLVFLVELGFAVALGVIDRLPLYAGRGGGVLERDRRPGADRRIDRHRRRHAGVLRRHRRGVPGHLRCLAADEEIRI